jgi:hypothetical protein
MDKVSDLPAGTPSSPKTEGKQIDLQEQPKVLQPVARLARALGVEVLAIALFILVLLVVSWFVVPECLRNYLNKRGSELPDYKLDIHSIQINPIACSIDLNQIVLEKKSNLISVPFFVAEKVHIALQWTQIIHGSLRSNITLIQPVVNFVNGPTAETSQTFLEPVWVQTVKQLVPLEINQFKIHRGDLHYYDFHATPEINLQLTDLELVADNLSNATHSKDLMPTTVTITGHPLKVGDLECHLAVNTDLKQPTFSEKVRLEKVPAPALNSFIAKYGSVYAKSGDLAFYSEMVSKEGSYQGYMKPFFQDLQFEPMPKDQNGIAAVWASLLNGVKGLIQNDQKVIATQVPVSGQYKDPNIDFWAAAFGILKNAWLESLAQRFNSPELAPGGKPPEMPKLAKPVPPRP